MSDYSRRTTYLHTQSELNRISLELVERLKATNISANERTLLNNAITNINTAISRLTAIGKMI